MSLDWIRSRRKHRAAGLHTWQLQPNLQGDSSMVGSPGQGCGLQAQPLPTPVPGRNFHDCSRIQTGPDCTEPPIAPQGVGLLSELHTSIRGHAHTFVQVPQQLGASRGPKGPGWTQDILP